MIVLSLIDVFCLLYCRYPASMTLQWIDILVRSTLLGMHVLAESCRAAQGEQSAAVGTFYLTLWQQVVSALGSLLAAEEDASLAVRSRSAISTVQH